MKKTIITAILAATIILSVTACGTASGAAASTASSVPTTSDAAVPVPTATVPTPDAGAAAAGVDAISSASLQYGEDASVVDEMGAQATIQAVTDFVQSTNMMYFTTMEGDQPRVRPLSPLQTYHGKFFFITQSSKDVYQQLTANPKVEVLFMDGYDWLRITAEAVVETDPDDRLKMIEGGHANDPGIEAIYLKNATVVFYDGMGITGAGAF